MGTFDVRVSLCQPENQASQSATHESQGIRRGRRTRLAPFLSDALNNRWPHSEWRRPVDESGQMSHNDACSSRRTPKAKWGSPTGGRSTCVPSSHHQNGRGIRHKLLCAGRQTAHPGKGPAPPLMVTCKTLTMAGRGNGAKVSSTCPNVEPGSAFGGKVNRPRYCRKSLQCPGWGMRAFLHASSMRKMGTIGWDGTTPPVKP